MLRILFITICLGICSFTNTMTAQTDEIILDYAEQSPVFPGGPDSLYAFIGRNILYPAVARENNISGKVVLKFYIDKKGYVRDLSVLKSISPALDTEALRVMELMNTQGYRWTPAMHEGQVVSMHFVMPINFVLQDVDGDPKKKRKRN